MFDLQNARAEYLNQNKLILNKSQSSFFAKAILEYLNLESDLETYKLARFMKIKSEVAMYLEWLYQFHNLYKQFDLIKQMYLELYIPNYQSKTSNYQQLFETKFTKELWPKILLSFNQILNGLVHQILNNQPYLYQNLHFLDEKLYDYSATMDLAMFEELKKDQILLKAKYTSSYIKVSLPLLIGIKTSVVEDKVLAYDSIDWLKLEDLLCCIGMLHHIQNNKLFMRNLLNTDKTQDQKVEEELNNQEPSNQEQKILLDQITKRANKLLLELRLTNEHQVLLDNMISWCSSYKDTSYQQVD
jgi:hypothetical protein